MAQARDEHRELVGPLCAAENPKAVPQRGELPQSFKVQTCSDCYCQKTHSPHQPFDIISTLSDCRWTSPFGETSQSKLRNAARNLRHSQGTDTRNNLKNGQKGDARRETRDSIKTQRVVVNARLKVVKILSTQVPRQDASLAWIVPHVCQFWLTLIPPQIHQAGAAFQASRPGLPRANPSTIERPLRISLN
jgi:hypothetical protein